MFIPRERLLLAAATVVFSLVGCTRPAASPTPGMTEVPTETRSAGEIPTEAGTREIDCRETVETFLSKVPSAFESVDDGIKWCETCVSADGIPTLSYDAGPFCNLRTSDAGTICTDSSQCEGVCLSENAASESGRCSDTERVLGCVFEMTDGESREICFD